MDEKHIFVAAHGHCFDGLVSAAMFTHLRQSLDPRPLRFSYKSCGYGPNMQVVPERWLRGDENAIVDFRFSDSDKLNWYFDHHVTAFSSDEQRQRALSKNARFFFEPDYGSCTKLIADVGQARYGVDFGRYAELVSWADKVDSAAFPTAAEAIDRKHPMMKLAALVEQHGDGPFLSLLAPRLLTTPADELLQDEALQQLWQPLADARDETQQKIAARLNLDGIVAFADLHDVVLSAGGKFIAYALAPQCVYSVAVLRMKQHFKVSVGFNPWSPQARGHDIAGICRRHGGGGHPVVGAFSVAIDKPEQARRLAREVVEELNR